MSGNSSVKINELQLKNFPSSTDAVVTWSTASNAVVLVPISNMYNGSNAALLSKRIVLTDANTPANSSANTQFGQMWTDGTYLYVGTGNNTIKRVALSSF